MPRSSKNRGKWAPSQWKQENEHQVIENKKYSVDWEWHKKCWNCKEYELSWVTDKCEDSASEPCPCLQLRTLTNKSKLVFWLMLLVIYSKLIKTEVILVCEVGRGVTQGDLGGSWTKWKFTHCSTLLVWWGKLEKQPYDTNQAWNSKAHCRC